MNGHESNARAEAFKFISKHFIIYHLNIFFINKLNEFLLEK